MGDTISRFLPWLYHWCV